VKEGEEEGRNKKKWVLYKVRDVERRCRSRVKREERLK
jgi:hypothetical protein